jgi:hypothetical protein
MAVKCQSLLVNGKRQQAATYPRCDVHCGFSVTNRDMHRQDVQRQNCRQRGVHAPNDGSALLSRDLT